MQNTNRTRPTEDAQNVYVAVNDRFDFQKAYWKFNTKVNGILEMTVDEDLWLKIKYFYLSLGKSLLN